MTSATKNHLEITLKNLRTEAVHAGLMGEDEKLYYEKGSKANGVTSQLWVGQRGSTAGFVPAFTLRTTQREEILMMEAATRALFALRMAKLSHT